jgi:nitroreductase/NAD-dependent dihydropyrimidine dehydrogenase PreA subunit
MISVDKVKCIKCGTCISMMEGYCISSKEGYPVFDFSVCNLCKKCVAVCPSQAIMINNVYPDKIKNNNPVSPSDLKKMFEKRRSIKHFKKQRIPRRILEDIVSVAKYAPNQNNNILLLVIDDSDLIDKIDKKALSFVKFFYRLFFSIKPLVSLFDRFFKGLKVIKRKMELTLKTEKHVVKKNTQALIIAVGDRKAPVTESSAYYVLATMMYYAEALGIGTCLMDSLKITFRTNKSLREKIKIKKDVLGVLSLGYSNENIVNIPRGYELNIQWNK